MLEDFNPSQLQMLVEQLEKVKLQVRENPGINNAAEKLAKKQETLQVVQKALENAEKVTTKVVKDAKSMEERAEAVRTGKMVKAQLRKMSKQVGNEIEEIQRKMKSEKVPESRGEDLGPVEADLEELPKGLETRDSDEMRVKAEESKGGKDGCTGCKNKHSCFLSIF